MKIMPHNYSKRKKGKLKRGYLISGIVLIFVSLVILNRHLTIKLFGYNVAYGFFCFVLAVALIYLSYEDDPGKMNKPGMDINIDLEDKIIRAKENTDNKNK